ncbi:unnamed protein product [Dibothriocephalus latus]|uniref:DUF4806 domain-containing protein n=1 Tax=Dibothriocephalus latus TaxID=60516 RepID=A0A3P7PHI2_DIBLA|nr:unnamed protein product [Dibothriocephalus latus]
MSQNSRKLDYTKRVREIVPKYKHNEYYLGSPRFWEEESKVVDQSSADVEGKGNTFHLTIVGDPILGSSNAHSTSKDTGAPPLQEEILAILRDVKAQKQHFFTAMEGKINALQEQTNDKLSALEETVKQLTTAPARMTSWDAECPLPSPIRTMDDLDSFEENLKDKDYRQQAVAFLRTLGGAKVLDFVKRIFEPLYSNHLLSQFNTTGTHNRRNFRQTRSFALLEEVFVTWTVQHHAHTEDLLRAVRTHLKSAQARELKLSKMSNGNPF